MDTHSFTTNQGTVWLGRGHGKCLNDKHLDMEVCPESQWEEGPYDGGYYCETSTPVTVTIERQQAIAMIYHMMNHLKITGDHLNEYALELKMRNHLGQ